MPPVKKPKAQKIENAGSPAKKKAVKKDVVSGQLSKKLKPQKENGPERGVILVKHLPHGFFEQQLRQYFKQFGNVLRLRLGRSERTGNSKGYAFVEFEYPEVAKVAAETMDNYLMFQKVVKAKYIPPEKQRSSFFKTTVKKVKNKAGKDIYVSKLTQSRQRSVNKHNDWDEAACQKRTVGTARKLRKLYDKYKDVDIPLLSLVVEPVKKTATEAEKENKKPAKKEQQFKDLLGTTTNDESDDEEVVEVVKFGKNQKKEVKEAKPGKKQKQPANLSAHLVNLLRSTINDEDNVEEAKPGKKQKLEAKKGVKEAKPGKKQKQAAKKELQLEDLLGTTINDESDDEDYVEEAKPGKKQKLEAKKEVKGAKPGKKQKQAAKKELQLEDLLGTTINDESDDEDYVEEAKPAKKQKLKEKKEVKEAKPGKKQKQAAKKELQLEDLLGTTINDESDDEDYEEEAKPGKKQKLEAKKEVKEAKAGKKQKQPAKLSANLEKFLRSTIKEDSNGKDYQDNGEDLPSPPKKASKKISAAPVDKLKRKPGTGGVQKKKIAAPTAKVDKKAAAQKLLLEEALKLTKPKSKGKKSKK